MAVIMAACSKLNFHEGDGHHVVFDFSTANSKWVNVQRCRLPTALFTISQSHALGI